MGDKDDLDNIIDNVTEQEQEYAQNALNEFKKKNYAGAQQIINKLDTRHNDFKVLHNKLLVEYCKNDCKKTEQFQRNLTSLCNQFKIKLDRLDDVDHCIMHYNQAILLYHQRQYTTAINVMERVYKFIEPMDDDLAKKVSLFAIELQLCVCQPDKAMSLINYLENHIIDGTPNIKLLDKTTKEKKPPSDPATEEFRKKLLKYKARCSLMSHNLQEASRQIKILAGAKSIDSMFFAAHFEYLKGNLQGSQKILTSIPADCLVYNDCGESSNVLFYNNIGILHFAMGKPNLACHYFQMALKEDLANSGATGQESNERPLYTLGGSKYHQIMFNLGVALLMAKKPAQAFDCLIVAVRRYHRNSRLWMRLAECCIMLNKESNRVDFDIQKKQKEVVVDVIGTGDQQKVILTTNLSKDKKYNSESQSYAVPVPSLEFASLCLKNAQLLLPLDTGAAPPVPLFLIPGVTPPIPSSNPGPAPSNPLSEPSGLVGLKNAIFAASAYVALCLGDYIIALEHAESLLRQERIGGAHKLLGHLYSAEALVLLDRIPEALEHLNPDRVKDVALDLPGVEGGDNVKTSPTIDWFPHNVTTAHSTMQYNVAVAKTIRGQWDEAIELLKKVWRNGGQFKVPGHIIMLVLYIELQLGHPEPARNLIKQYLFQNRVCA